ncbi:hypothetical protein L5515_018385 [Caenorhabditis briggsae]|uniref:Ig-like domain-containing protein n=10 Tax=Caenorhabditis TaxID=6237 RepID=A0AAE9FBA2_CAEBR|nr:hypothetical protein L5515_018385 [Caenorhabditis briggsae]
MSSCSTITVYSQDNERPGTSNRSFGECGSRSQFVREIEKWSGLPRTSTPIKNPGCSTSIRPNTRHRGRTRDSPQLALAQPKLSLTAIRSHLSSFRPISRTDQWVEDVKKLNRYDKTEYLELLQGSNGSNASIQMLLKNQRPDLDDEGEPIGQETIKERSNNRHPLGESNPLDKSLSPQEKNETTSRSPQRRPASDLTVLLDTLQNKNGTNQSIQRLLKRQRPNVDSEGESEDTKRPRISKEPLLPRSDSSSPEIYTNVRGCMERNMGMLLRQQQQRQDESEKRAIQEKQSTSSGANYPTSLVRTKPKTSENSSLPQIRLLSKSPISHPAENQINTSMHRNLKRSTVGSNQGDVRARKSLSGALSPKVCTGINESVQQLLRQQRPDVDSEGETIDEKNKNRSTEKSLVFKSSESMKYIGANQNVQEILKQQRPDLDSEGETIRDGRSTSSSLSPQLQIISNEIIPSTLKPLYGQIGINETTRRFSQQQQNNFAVGNGTIQKRKSVSSSPAKYRGINHRVQQLLREQRPDVDSEGETVEERRPSITAFKIRFIPECLEPTDTWQDEIGTNERVQKLMKELRPDVDSDGESIDIIYEKPDTTTSKQKSPRKRKSMMDCEWKTIQTRMNKSDTLLQQINTGINESVQELLRKQRPDVDSEGETIEERNKKCTRKSLVIKSTESMKYIGANQSLQEILKQQRPDLDSEGETMQDGRCASEADGVRGRHLKQQRNYVASGGGSIRKRKSISSSPNKFTGINHIVQELLRQQRPHLDSEGETAEERKTRSPTLKILFIKECPEPTEMLPDDIGTNKSVQKLMRELRPDVDSEGELVETSQTRITDRLLVRSHSNSFIPFEKFRGCTGTSTLKKEHANADSEGRATQKRSWQAPSIAKSPKLLGELKTVTGSPLKMQETIWRQRQDIEFRWESIDDKNIRRSYQSSQPSPYKVIGFNGNVQESPKKKHPIIDEREKLSLSSTDPLPHRKSQSLESSHDSKRLKLPNVLDTPSSSKQSVPEDTSSTSMNDSFGSNLSFEPCSAFEEKYAFGPRGRVLYITVQWINPGRAGIKCRIGTWTETEFCDVMPDGKAPHFPQQPVARQNDDGSLELECFVDANPTPQVKWYYDNKEVENSGRFSANLANKGSDSYSAILTIKELADADAGAYRCAIVNPHGKGNANFNLKLTGFSSPTFVEKPQISSRDDGQVMVMEFRAKSILEPTFVWQKLVGGGAEEIIANSDRIKAVKKLEAGNVYYSALEIKEPTKDKDAGQFICTVKNESGKLTATFTVKFEVPEGAPSFTRKPQILQQTSSGGEPAICFDIGYSARMNPQVTWISPKSKKMKESSRIKFKTNDEGNGNFTAQLELTNYKAKDSGTYTCNIKNDAGEANVELTLNIEGPLDDYADDSEN